MSTPVIGWAKPTRPPTAGRPERSGRVPPCGGPQAAAHKDTVRVLLEASWRPAAIPQGWAAIEAKDKKCPIWAGPP